MLLVLVLWVKWRKLIRVAYDDMGLPDSSMLKVICCCWLFSMGWYLVGACLFARIRGFGIVFKDGFCLLFGSVCLWFISHLQRMILFWGLSKTFCSFVS